VHLPHARAGHNHTKSMKQKAFSISHIIAGVILGLCLAAASPLGAEVYTWTDEKGVVHMTDRKIEDPGKKVKEMTGMQGPPAQGGRKEMIQAMLANARNNPGYGELQKIAADYRRNHTYSMADYFVCIDMALEMANILKTRNFSPKVVAGTPKTDTAGLDPAKARVVYDHAWVAVELQPGTNVVIETTGGYVVDEKVPNFEYYYQGLVFRDPRQAKDTVSLIRSVQDNCKKAQELLRDWNATYVGRTVDQQALEAKGRAEAKLGECLASTNQYEELIKTQYRRLY